MALTTAGMHHVTAISGDPQANFDFYSRVLGLRFVKKTVNFDDPHTYHLYYGDETGKPGTILTYFPWGAGSWGRIGSGQVTSINLAVPEGSLDYWTERLMAHDVEVEGPIDRFAERLISLPDPDGITIELIEDAGADPSFAWTGGDVPAEHAIRGVHSLLLHSRAPEKTAELLVSEFGFHEMGREGDRWRLQAREGGPGSIVDILTNPESSERGRMGSGVIHHVAWRARDDDEQAAWRERLLELGYNVTEVRDRQYFRSIYFVEPGGILFEIATDIPGFTVDEAPEELGTSLKLPPWYEARRNEIEGALRPLET